MARIEAIPSDYVLVRFDFSAYDMEDEITIAYLPVGKQLGVPGTVIRRLPGPEVLKYLRLAQTSGWMNLLEDD